MQNYICTKISRIVDLSFSKSVKSAKDTNLMGINLRLQKTTIILSLITLNVPSNF